jgi:hypothetical protein
VGRGFRIRFQTIPDPAARRRVERCLEGADGFSWNEALLDARGALDEESLAAADALWPISEVDLGDGLRPYGEPEPSAEGGLDFADSDEPARPEPAPPDPEVAARYEFDDYVLASPGGKHVAFVRSEDRCHFTELHVLDGDETRRLTIPSLTHYPRHAWSKDGAHLLVGGEAHVLELDLASGRLLQLFHEEGGAAIDVCWVGPRRVAAASFRHLIIADLSGQKVEIRRYPCQSGRLVRAVLGGRVLVVGTDGGTAALGVDGARVRRLGVDWRNLVDAWDWGDRVLALGAHGGVMELRGLGEAWAHAFAGSGPDDPDPLAA